MAYYLGIDASTQGIKAELIEITGATGQIAGSYSVNFGRDLPQYNAPNGFIEHPDSLLRHADPLMWLDALELLFARMRDAGAPINEIRGISGSGQQHGSVYLNASFAETLANMDPAKSLAEQLKPCLSRPTSPIWMDRSTAAQCRELSEQFGDYLQKSTGSPAIERFSGSQIMKFVQTEPENYAKTRCIHLVSSFLASVLAGKSVPIDFGDGAGMNLLNLELLQWDKKITEFIAPDLIDKLPKAVASNTLCATIAPYFAKYGFANDCKLNIWSGDNPNSLIGVGAGSPGVAVISLGTSDTFFAAMDNFRTDPDGFGHVFGNPAGGFMSLICFTNGSLARQKIRDMAQCDWNFFDEAAMNLSSPGNGGKLMLPYFEPESTPLVLKPEAKYNFIPSAAHPAELIRSVLESQALSMRLHSRWQKQNFTRIRVTGGASKSIFIRQVLADVFQAEIESIQVDNSAGLGAALRAANAVGKLKWEQLYAIFSRPIERIMPDRAKAKIYDRMLLDYADFEQK